MNCKDKNGRPVYISVWGSRDDLQIDEAYYLDADDEAVSDEMCAWIAKHYSAEMEEAYFDNMCGRADAMMDAWKDGTYDS
jgi:hypothetical protein